MKNINCIGMTLDQFKRMYGDQNFRIKRIDGVPQRLDADYNPDRINLTIEDGIIVEVDWF